MTDRLTIVGKRRTLEHYIYFPCTRNGKYENLACWSFKGYRFSDQHKSPIPRMVRSLASDARKNHVPALRLVRQIPSDSESSSPPIRWSGPLSRRIAAPGGSHGG
jgi:hypothetical protein